MWEEESRSPTCLPADPSSHSPSAFSSPVARSNILHQADTAATMKAALGQRWEHLQASPGGGPSSDGSAFRSTLDALAGANQWCKPKDKLYIAALADFYTKGKGPDNMPMSDAQVHCYHKNPRLVSPAFAYLYTNV